MKSCRLADICEAYIHPFSDGTPYHPDMIVGYLDVERCILTGFRDTTVGRYVYGNQFFDDIAEDAIIHVHADRSVTFAAHSVGPVAGPNGVYQEDVYAPAQTCMLQPPEYFDACLNEHDDETHYQCMQGWWMNCVESGPRCE